MPKIQCLDRKKVTNIDVGTATARTRSTVHRTVQDSYWYR